LPNRDILKIDKELKSEPPTPEVVQDIINIQKMVKVFWENIEKENVKG
jgi:HD-like signal output (HDOD) protein